MTDPIQRLYEFSVQKGVLDSSLSPDNFRTMFTENQKSRETLFANLKQKQVFKDEAVFADFERDFLPTKDTFKSSKLSNIPINTDVKIELSEKDKQGFSFNKNKAIDEQLVEKGIFNFTPSQVSEIKYGDRDNNKINSAKNASPLQKKAAAFIEAIGSTKPFDVGGPYISYMSNIAKSAGDIETRADEIALDVKLQQYSEYENLLELGLNKAVSKYKDNASLSKFIELDNKVSEGGQLSPEEKDFYSKQLDLIGDNEILSILDKKREIRNELLQLPHEHKQAFLKKKLEDSEQKQTDKALNNGFVRALYNIGEVVNSAPGRLAEKLGTTYLTAKKDVGALSLLSGGDESSWLKTSKQKRQGNEDIAVVNFKGSKYEAAFDDKKRLYAIYDSDGNKADLTPEEEEQFVAELNRQNPKHETKRVKNLEALTVSGLESLSDVVGTMALTMGSGAAVKAISSLGKVGQGISNILGSSRVLEFVPTIAQYTGTYAKQAIRDGGIIDPDKVAQYGLIGGASEALIETLINPMLGRAARGLTGLDTKFSKEVLEDAIKGPTTFRRIWDKSIKSVLKDLGGEIVEEEVANVVNFTTNEIYNKSFKAGFDNENPLTLENIIDTAYTTAVASILPSLLGAGGNTKQSSYVREALFRSLKNPQQAETVFNKYRESASKEDLELFNDFKKHYDNTLDLSKPFIEGNYKDVSDDVKKEVFHKNFEISRLQNNKDEKSKAEVESLKTDVKEITLKAKYDIDSDITFSAKDKNEVLDKIDESFANKDLTGMKPSTRGKLYKEELSQILNDPTLSVKDLNKDIEQDKIDTFNAEVNAKITELRDKYTLPEIEQNLLNSEILAKSPLKKEAREIYIKKAIKEQRDIELKRQKEKEDKEFQAKVEQRKIIMSKLSKGDKLIDKLTGFEYTYEGYGDTPIIINSDGNPLINANAQVVTPQELIETLDTNYEIIKKPVEQDTTYGFSTNTTFTPTNRPGNLTTSLNTNIAEGAITTNNINTEGDIDNAILFENFVNPNQSEESWDRIAFLGLDYDEQVEKGLIDRETTDHIVYENAKFFLDPKNVAPGTKLEAKINDSDSTIVYDPSKEVRTETTWGELKGRLTKGDIKTPTGLKLNYNDLVPIDLYIDGKKIPGNIHTKAWVEKNALSETKGLELQKVEQLRKAILSGNTKLIITSYTNGPINIDEPTIVPSDVKIEEVGGKLFAKTITGNVSVYTDLVSDREVNSVISAIKIAFGIDDGKGIINKLKDQINRKEGLENYISKFVKVEKPVNSSFTKLVAEKAKFSTVNKVSTVSIEVNSDITSDTGFSILLGKTYAQSSNYTIVKFYQKEGKYIVEEFIGGKLRPTDMNKDQFFSYLEGALAQKRINYKRTQSIEFIENNTVVSEEYNEYIRPHVKSNLVFTKVGNSHSIYYQPKVVIESLEAEIKPTSSTSELSEEDEVFFLYPETDSNIGKYLEDYTIKGISEKLFTDISRGILGSAYKQFVKEDGISVNELVTSEIQTQLDMHKGLLDRHVFKSAAVNEAKKNIIDNWNKIENNVKRLLKDNLKKEVEDVEDIDDYISDYHDDGKFFTKDVFLSASKEIKTFFNFIPNTSGKFKSVFALGENSDFFNFYYTANEVLTKITYALASSASNYVDPSWEQMKSKLLQSKIPFKLQFIERAETLLDESKLNELVSVLYNSFKNMTLLEVTGTSSKIISVSSEQNFDKKKEEWIDKFLNSGLVTLYQEEDSDTFIPTDKFNKVIKELEDLLDKPNVIENKTISERIAPLSRILDSLGITLDDRTYTILESGDHVNYGLTEKNGTIFTPTRGNLVKTIIDSLSKKNVESIRDLFSDSMFKKLALLDLEISKNNFSNVVRNGDKQIQTIGIPRNYEVRLSRFINSNKLDYLSKTFFGMNIYWNKVKQIMDFESVPPNAMRNKKNKDDSGFETFSYKDHILYRLHRFVASQKGIYKRASYVTAPMEDKKNPLVITAPRFDIISNNVITNTAPVTGDAIDLLIHQLVVPELIRVKNEENNDISGYKPKNFYIIPELNKIAEEIIKNFRDDVAIKEIQENDTHDVSSWFETSSFYENLRDIIENHLNKAVEVEAAKWESQDIKYSDLPSHFRELQNKEKNLGIKNYVLNYMIFHSNEHLLTGDPALYFKAASKETRDEDFNIYNVIESLKNKQKRLALLNAPYTHIAEPKDIKVASITDPLFKSATSEFLDKYIDVAGTKYINKEASDAQLFATADNYIDTVFRMGKITKKERDNYLEKIAAQRIDIENLGYVQEKNKIPFSSKENPLHPLKTVLGDFKNETSRERVVYIKMAEFPLIPQLTQGLEIDKLRRHLEKINVDKAVFKTGFKVGSPKSGVINKTGNTIDSIDITEENTIIVNELFYGEQSENPQDYSYIVPHGSQRSKLEFVNILGEYFKHPFKEGQITGRELKKIRDSKYEKLFKLKLDKLQKRLMLPNGSLNYEELSEILEGEIREFDPTYAYSLSKDVIENKIPLWINPLFERITPKLLAIVESSVLKTKVRGKSYVQVFSDFFSIPSQNNNNNLSEEQIADIDEIVNNAFDKKWSGDRLRETLEKKGYNYDDFINLKSFRSFLVSKTNIIGTPNFTGELKSIRDEDGKIVAGQILVPWNFKIKGKDGDKEVSITDFTKGNQIDFNKVPKEFLESIGFRIPTSGHNSITRLEVVGFLPKWVGNTILMPSDLMVQMGSDLDFDKLYSLFYNLEGVKDSSGNYYLMDPRKITDLTQKIGSMIEEGEYDTLLDREDSQIQELENDLLDISRAIYLSDSEVLRNLNHKPIGFGKLEDLAKSIPSKTDIIPSSPNYHIEKYLSGRVGKIGIGSFSIDNTFHAALQGTGIEYRVTNPEHFPFIEGEELIDEKGNPYKLISLDRVKTNQSINEKDVKKIRYVSDIYSAFQNASTDEGKEQLLQTLGITADTFNFVRGMVQTGHEEDEIYNIVKQPIIKALMTELSKYSGLFGKYKDQGDILNEMINSEKDPNNLKTLLEYQAYYDIGAALTGIRSIFNLDSKGFSGTAWTPILKEQKIAELEFSNFTNIDNILYTDNQATYLFSSTSVGLRGMDMFYTDRLIPFKNQLVSDVINSIVSKVPNYYKNSSASESELRTKIFRDWTKYFYSGFKNLFGVTDIDAERKRLLLTDNLSNKITDIKKSTNDKLKNNIFIQLLSSKKVDNINFVVTPNVQNSNTDLDLQRAVIDLYESNTPISENYSSKDLVNDLYKYAYLVSQETGPNSFLKYLPLDYIYENSKLPEVTLDSLYRKSLTKLSEEYNSFLIQFFQHNPKYLPVVGSKELTEIRDGVFQAKSKALVHDLVKYRSEELDVVLVKIDGLYSILPTVGNYLHSMYDNEATSSLKPLTQKKESVTPTSGESVEIPLKQLLSDEALSKLNKEGVVFKYLNKLAQYTPDVKVVIAPDLGAEGGYSPKKNTIYLSSKLTGENLYKKLAHELLHAVDWNLTNPESKKIREEIDALYTEIYNAQSDSFKNRVQELNKRRVLDGKNFKLSPKEKEDHIYAMSNPREFFAFFTDEETGFRDWINGKDVARNGWYDKLRSLIKKLINSLTGSKELTDVIDSYIFDIIEKKSVNTKVNPTTQPVEKVNVEKILDKNQDSAFEYNDIKIETEFNLGSEQADALSRLIDFINSKDSKVITLQGQAGTGKTTIIGYLQKYFGGSKTFGYMAPTHAATAELAFATVKTGNTFLPSTLQSSLSISPKTGKTVFSVKLQKKLGFKPVIVLDEASMIDDYDLNRIYEAIDDINGKLILIGDEKQISKVSTANRSSKTVSPAFTKVQQIRLSKVFRQEDNSLLSLLSKMRNQTTYQLFEVPNSEAISFVKKSDFEEGIMIDAVKNPEDTTVISYTNKSVKDYNSKVRQILGRTGETKVGDIIIGYLGYASKQIEKSDIANSVKYTISDITKNGPTVYIEATSQRLAKLISLGIKEIRSIASTTYYQLSSDDSLTFDHLTENDFILNNNKVSEYFRTIHNANLDYANKKINYNTYLNIMIAISDVLRKVSVGNDYVYNPETDKMELYDIKKHSKIKTNGQGSLLFNKDIDYGHAITIHKSQGTTIDTVYFDSNSLSSSRDVKIVDDSGNQITTEKMSLAYVAMSRSKNKLVVYKGSNDFSDVNSEDDIVFELYPEVTINNQDEIRSDVSELFESNPELANAVYEALGVKQANISFNIEPFGKSIDNIDVIKDGKKIGYVQISKNNNTKTLIVTGIELKEKGFGKNVYLKLQQQYPDFTIKSDSKNLSEAAIKMWDSLVSKKLAIKQGDKQYTLDTKQAQQLYSNFLSNFVDNNFDTIIQDLQTKNILDKKCS